jgi:hypothetical protein
VHGVEEKADDMNPVITSPAATEWTCASVTTVEFTTSDRSPFGVA